MKPTGRTDLKTTFVSTKLSPALKERLEAYAESKDWTLAHAVRNCIADVVSKEERAAAV
jgi:predicted transcriptional regulator